MNNSRKVVIALIKNDEGKYLLTKLANYYPSYQEHKDEWCPIGGHIKKGETPKETLIREGEEELKVKLKPIRQIAEWEHDIPGETAVWWEAKIASGQIDPKRDEIEEFGYFSKDEAKNLKLWPATRKFFEKFIWKK